MRSLCRFVPWYHPFICLGKIFLQQHGQLLETLKCELMSSDPFACNQDQEAVYVSPPPPFPYFDTVVQIEARHKLVVSTKLSTIETTL